MSHDLLHTIQRLQFNDRSKAESLLLDFIRETFPGLDITALELRPQAVSLNSFNGFLMLADGGKLFFKTHVEQDNVIGEYYNAKMLAESGYPVIQPLYSSTRSGQQLVIYEVVTDPSVFDVARAVETGKSDLFTALTTAQQHSDDQLFEVYTKTSADQTSEEAASAPIHQLFYHRLTGGRLERFYGDETQIQLPAGTFTLADVRQVRWAINGCEYKESLNQIIERAICLLHPAQAGPSVIGHGDAHNGNVFFNPATRLTYFDPAFAGRHHPLLDLTKPLFHNVFAMWMYFPAEERDSLRISLKMDGDVWQVEHNYALNPLREMFLISKIERVLIPILRRLKAANQLRPDWREYLKAALFCCPFLTLDLKRFPPEIALLGLTMTVQMGAESENVRSRIDSELDRVTASL